MRVLNAWLEYGVTLICPFAPAPPASVAPEDHAPDPAPPGALPALPRVPPPPGRVEPEGRTPSPPRPSPSFARPVPPAPPGLGGTGTPRARSGPAGCAARVSRVAHPAGPD